MFARYDNLLEGNVRCNTIEVSSVVWDEGE